MGGLTTSSLEEIPHDFFEEKFQALLGKLGFQVVEHFLFYARPRGFDPDMGPTFPLVLNHMQASL